MSKKLALASSVGVDDACDDGIPLGRQRQLLSDDLETVCLRYLTLDDLGSLYWTCHGLANAVVRFLSRRMCDLVCTRPWTENAKMVVSLASRHCRVLKYIDQYEHTLPDGILTRLILANVATLRHVDVAYGFDAVKQWLGQCTRLRILQMLLDARDFVCEVPCLSALHVLDINVCGFVGFGSPGSQSILSQLEVLFAASPQLTTLRLQFPSSELGHVTWRFPRLRHLILESWRYGKLLALPTIEAPQLKGLWIHGTLDPGGARDICLQAPGMAHICVSLLDNALYESSTFATWMDVVRGKWTELQEITWETLPPWSDLDCSKPDKTPRQAELGIRIDELRQKAMLHRQLLRFNRSRSEWMKIE